MSIILRHALLIVVCWATLAVADAPSLLSGMPSEVPPLRNDRLDKAGYEALVEQWQAYSAEHPRSAVAHAQLARALRYADAPAEDVAAQMDRALELGPDCPEALDLAASRYLGEWESNDAAACYELGLKAEALAPRWPDIHFTMHPLALAAGKADEADRHLAALLDKGGIPAPVLDYCYNMLVSAAPNAVLFTNGDNDTYGTLALQVARGVRPDVLVLNLSLISQPEVRETLHARLEDGDPLTAARRAELYDEFIQNYVRDREMYSVKYVKAVAERAAAGELDRPIYLALTVHADVLKSVPCPRRLEGMLWRLLPGEGDREPVEAAMDGAASWALFRDQLRLDSATDLSLDWSVRRSVGRLMDNYPAVLVRVAAAAAEAGDLETARAALRLGLDIAVFHGRTGTADGMLEYWQDLDPDNPEIETWREKTKG